MPRSRLLKGAVLSDDCSSAARLATIQQQTEPQGSSYLTYRTGIWVRRVRETALCVRWSAVSVRNRFARLFFKLYSLPRCRWARVSSCRWDSAAALTCYRALTSSGEVVPSSPRIGTRAGSVVLRPDPSFLTSHLVPCGIRRGNGYAMR